jgi:hypothetical protein
MPMKAGDEAPADLKVTTVSEKDFRRFGTDAEWFRAQLASRDVKLVTGSQMDLALKAMTQISTSFGTAARLPPTVVEELTRIVRDQGVGDSMLRRIRDGIGAANLVRAVRKALEVDPRIFDGKWDLFRGPDVVLARYERQTAERNLTWELYVAALCLLAAKSVSIAGTENPDIRCWIRNVCWGVECKVFDSQSPDAHMRSIKTAARQLDGSDVDRGFIAVNLTSVIDHARFLQSLRAFGTPEFDGDAILVELRRQAQTIVRPFTETAFENWARKYRKTRAIFFQAQAIALTETRLSLTTYRRWVALHRPQPTDLVWPVQWPEAPDQAMENRFAKAVESF